MIHRRGIGEHARLRGWLEYVAQAAIDMLDELDSAVEDLEDDEREDDREAGVMEAADVRVLIACEWSGTVREAFLARGFDAWSCDRVQAEPASNRHIRADVRTILGDGWDLLIVAHPPCTRLCKSGLRWLSRPPRGRTLEAMWRELDEAAALFSTLWAAPVRHVAVENPRMHRHAQERIQSFVPPAQVIQPWQFGHGETKATCLWLRDLPLLQPTNIVEGRAERIHRMPQTRMRKRERSRFFKGIAAAMADQWGDHVLAALSQQVAA